MTGTHTLCRRVNDPPISTLVDAAHELAGLLRNKLAEVEGHVDDGHFLQATDAAAVMIPAVEALAVGLRIAALVAAAEDAPADDDAVVR